jgi:hypothetical protein
LDRARRIIAGYIAQQRRVADFNARAGPPKPGRDEHKHFI